jgi:KaiC/GvpD/RAD55 family RecA-like ATPase
MISELVWRAVVTSESIAAVLADVEKQGPIESARDGRAIVRPSIKRHFPHLSKHERERTEWVISNSWAHTVSARSARRPDVLGLTCDLLANPEVPLTRDVTRFVVTLGLRSLYGMEYNAAALQALRDAHSQLSRRFERQQRARIRKAEPLESLIIDLACLDGSLSRSLTRKNLRVYYNGFKSPFGITQQMRQYAEEQDWPELHGSLPDFASITKLAFAQPTCIAGMDDVVQGLLAAVPSDDNQTNSGGLVTLVAGPPGSGKTSLCLTLASRMAELGAVVSYVATEEATHALKAKLVSFVDPNYLASALLPNLEASSSHDALGFVDGRELDSFISAVDALTKELDDARPQLPTTPEAGLYLTFPRVLVIDSLTALMHVTDDHGTRRIDRHSLAVLLSKLRDRGICVFLVGGPSDCTDEGLAYLVDNVFLLDSEERFGVTHRIRLFDVYKTRLQSAYRGRHVLHLSRNEGCTINPSLHSLARHLHEHKEGRGVPSRDSLATTDSRSSKARILKREPSQVLVYGHGSAGKARFALTLGLSSRVPYERYPHLKRPAALDPDARVLVVSFLYGPEYYEQIAQGLLHAESNSAVVQDDEHLTVLDLYPGFLDPETLVARIAKTLHQGRLEGRRYTSVIVDGIHNILVQFPLLQDEPLLWPTLYRVFRSEGVDAISTFTFFRVPTISGPSIEMVSDSQRLFAHLLISNCDYSFVVERSQTAHDLLDVRLASAPSPTADIGTVFRWNPDTFEFVSAAARPQKARSEPTH